MANTLMSAGYGANISSLSASGLKWMINQGGSNVDTSSYGLSARYISKSGVWKKLAQTKGGGSFSTGTAWIDFIINGVEGNQQVNLGNFSARGVDMLNTDQTIAEDQVNAHLYGNPPCSGGVITITGPSIQFHADAELRQLLNTEGSIYGGNNQIRYANLVSGGSAPTLDNTNGIKLALALTTRRYFIRISSNNPPVNTWLTGTILRNGSNGNEIISVAGSGLYTDNLNTDVYNEGDIRNVKYDTTASGTPQNSGPWGVEEEYNDDFHMLYNCDNAGASYPGGGVTDARNEVSGLDSLALGFPNQQPGSAPIEGDLLIDWMGVDVMANTTGTPTFHMATHPGPVNGNLNISLIGGDIGHFEDAVNSDHPFNLDDIMKRNQTAGTYRLSGFNMRGKLLDADGGAGNQAHIIG